MIFRYRLNNTQDQSFYITKLTESLIRLFVRLTMLTDEKRVSSLMVNIAPSVCNDSLVLAGIDPRFVKIAV